MLLCAERLLDQKSSDSFANPAIMGFSFALGEHFADCLSVKIPFSDFSPIDSGASAVAPQNFGPPAITAMTLFCSLAPGLLLAIRALILLPLAVKQLKSTLLLMPWALNDNPPSSHRKRIKSEIFSHLGTFCHRCATGIR